MLSAINAANYIDRYVVVAITPLLATDFHLNNRQVGELTTAFFVVYTAAAPFLGLMGDRMPRKYIVALSVGLWSIATAAGAYCPTFYWLLAARAAVGIGEAGYGSSCPSWLSDLFPPTRRGAALSVFALGLPVGTAVGYALGGWIGHVHGWRAALTVVGWPGLALSVAVLFLREPKRGENDLAPDGSKVVEVVDPHGAHKPSFADYGTLAVNVPYLYVCAGMAAMTFMMGGLAAFAPKFLVDVRHLPLEDAATRFGVVTAVAGFIGTVAGGWLSQRVAKGSTSGQLLVSGIGLLVAAPITAAAILAPDVNMFFILMFVAEICLFLNSGPLNAAIANVVPANVRTSAYSLNILLIHIFGDIPSPIAIGHLADSHGLTFAMASASIVAAVAGVILLIGARRVGRAASQASGRPG